MKQEELNYKGEDGEGDDDCPVSPPIGVCQEGSERRGEVAGALPRSNAARRRHVAPVLHLGQVAHEVRPHRVVRQSAAEFTACEEEQSIT